MPRNRGAAARFAADVKQFLSAIPDSGPTSWRVVSGSEYRSLPDLLALEEDWRALYPVAWTDFYRFLKGWSPGHWKIHGYSARMTRAALDAL